MNGAEVPTRAELLPMRGFEIAVVARSIGPRYVGGYMVSLKNGSSAY